MTDNKEELEELYGPAAAHSEYSIGQQITYNRVAEIKQGEIIYACAKGPGVIGQEQPLRYVVIPSEGGMVDVVYQSDIITQ